MIDYLKIEITPYTFAVQNSNLPLRKLLIQVSSSNKPAFQYEQIIEPDELVSFFDQIWDYVGKEILKALKEDEVSSPVPTGVPERP